ncbi:uncharacterized protein MELLADRAFT_90258 [Melampsora larici-populina 98AG31]|uniref:FAR1 domain-containing protein n=1 Tax=Melampsora larici-populina (strain 98AG31 / pathotype 3-4-7) TaxID=747676 RepID=F4RWA4_MELLP|nr:uncharacterized protein MELLADRAFT_90258 [Melampsora larici-populina 98AG31]EGG03356.1 hypothetical protein MELLADRAFT_90258 [Melampsora larici-populina 98AG31]
MQVPTTSNTPSPMLPPPLISALRNPDPEATEPFHHCKQLDKFVKEFAPHQGYGIIIGHSGRDPHLYCRYECHRGGKPAKRKGQTDATECNPPKKTRSIRIECPFKMKATFHRERCTWTLHHEITSHNHGPMEMEIPHITPSIAPTSAEQSLALDLSHEPTNVPLDTTVQSQLLSINNRILSMPTSQQDEILQSIHKLIDAVSNVPKDKIPTNAHDSHEQQTALQILEEMEQFNELIQFQSPLHVQHNDTSITHHQEQEKSPTSPSRIDVDAFNRLMNKQALMNDQPLMNDHPSFDSIDSFVYEDLLQPNTQQPGVQTTCQVLDVNTVAKHDYATNTNLERSLSSTLPSTTINKEPLPPHPVYKSSHEPPPQTRSTRSTIKKTASVSPRRTRSRLDHVTGVAAQSGVKRTQLTRTRSTLSAKKHK